VTTGKIKFHLGFITPVLDIPDGTEPRQVVQAYCAISLNMPEPLLNAVVVEEVIYEP
jgi:hypothetical protein